MMVRGKVGDVGDEDKQTSSKQAESHHCNIARPKRRAEGQSITLREDRPTPSRALTASTSRHRRARPPGVPPLDPAHDSLGALEEVRPGRRLA